MKAQHQGRSAAYFFIVLQSLLYGIGDPVSKAAYESMSVFSLLAVRYSLAFVCFFLVFRRQIMEDLRVAPLGDWLLPGLSIGLSYLFSNLALSMISATASAFLRSMTTLITPLIMWLVFHRRLAWYHLPLYLVVLAGLFLLCGGGADGLGPGELLGFLSSVFSAIGLVLAERSVQSRIRPVTLSTLQAGMSAIIALGGALLVEHGIHVSGAGVGAWAAILYLALACTGAGYFLQNQAMLVISARDVALLQCLAPVFTMVISYFMIGERIRAGGALGALLLLGCIIVEILLSGRQNTAPTE